MLGSVVTRPFIHYAGQGWRAVWLYHQAFFQNVVGTTPRKSTSNHDSSEAVPIHLERGGG